MMVATPNRGLERALYGLAKHGPDGMLGAELSFLIGVLAGVEEWRAWLMLGELTGVKRIHIIHTGADVREHIFVAGPSQRPGAYYWRALSEGYEVVVYPMVFTTRLCLSDTNEIGFIHDGWCYDEPLRALEAAETWSGEGDPLDGWHRHLGSGRRREGGDPKKETLRW